jgi:hypothetical protein
MLVVLSILAGVGIIVLILIFKQLQEISGAILRVSHQLEYLGAPLEVQNGMLVATRKSGAEPVSN